MTVIAVHEAAAQDGVKTVGMQEGRFGVGLTSSYPAYGVSGTLQVSEKLTAEGLLGFFGVVSNFGGRIWYRFNRNENYDLYGYGAAGIYRYDYDLIFDRGTESVLGLGGGVGIESGLKKLFKDEDFPPIFVNAEVGLAFANFENYGGFSTFLLGAGVHYRFGGN